MWLQYNGKKEYVIAANRILSWLNLCLTQSSLYEFYNKLKYGYFYNDYEQIIIPFLEKIETEDAREALHLYRTDEFDIKNITKAAMAVLNYYDEKPELFDMNVIKSY